ncbi:MAG: SDR family oxidoreductase, partial [Gammaproteobacteria bacterium]|nr:SDR family oxidoreductase [Gammaproteobacteria bacterium]
NMKGVYLVGREAARRMRERGAGVILNTASVVAHYGNIGQTNYGAAKAGIAAFSIIAARELRRIGVTVNAICPSAYTRMTEGLRQYSEEEIKKRDPHWVSPLIVYLASKQAGDITGRVFQAGGGMVAICEGWRRGAETEQMEEPAAVGEWLRANLSKVRKNSGMDGLELD